VWFLCEGIGFYGSVFVSFLHFVDQHFNFESDVAGVFEIRKFENFGLCFLKNVSMQYCVRVWVKVARDGIGVAVQF
jgi:hypothetical protein